MKHQLIKVLLSMSMSLTVSVVSAYDAEIDGIYYDFSGNEATVTYRRSDPVNNSYSGRITIPATVIYNNITYCVTSIRSSAFYGCPDLLSVIIPNSVTSIGQEAFKNCSNLTSVTIGNSVSYIGKEAFYNCRGLTSITIPNSVTNIGKEAFSGSHLISLTIGAGVLSIGEKAFYNNDSSNDWPLKVIWLTNTPPSGYINVKGKINYVANDLYTSFDNKIIYPFLSSIFEVDGVKYVPVSPSDRTCDAIDCNYDNTAENVHMGEKVTYRGIDLKVNEVQPYLCYQNPFIKKIIFEHNGNLPEYAFYNCKNLTSVTLSNQGHIGKSAFAYSQIATTLNINNAGNIDNEAFSNITGTFTAKVNNTGSIGAYAFYKSEGLKNLEISSNVTFIGEVAFCLCTSLMTASLSNQGSIGRRAFASSQINGSLTINSVGSIGESAFEGISGSFTAMVNNKGNIGTYAFRECIGLTALEIGDNVTTVGNSAYMSCSKLQTATINNIGSLRNNAFQSCTDLQTAILGNSIISIGQYAFDGCSSLQSIIIPDATTSLGSYAFQGCSNMISAKIGMGVTAIPTHEFSGCSSMTNIQIGPKVQNIDTYAFSSCKSLPEIFIPKAVASIGNYTFSGCSALKTVIMQEEESTLNLGSNGSSPLFKNCPLDSVFIGRNISYPTSSSEGYSPFYRNTSLRSIHVTDVETEVSPNEFYGCSNLKNVRLGDGITTIGDWAFSGCSSLDYFSFGSSVETIGKEAFSDCVSVTKIISKAATPPSCGNQALDDINKWNCTLFVPQGSLTSYQEAEQWKDFFFILIEERDLIPATSISLNHTQLSFNAANQTAKLTATVTPSNATYKNVTWTSSNTEVATVSSAGVVTSKGNGTATIIATTTDGTNLTASCNVVVSIKSLTTITINGVTHYEIQNAANFMEFASLVNNGENSANAVLTADINLSSVSSVWVPIGSTTIPYTGIFDGQGHTITGFEYTAISDCNGLFGVINNATVKNFSISGTLTSQKDWNGVVGKADGTSFVSGIHSSLTINVSNCVAHSGGVVGGSTQSRLHTVLVDGCEYSGILTHSGVGDCQAGILGYTNGGGVKNCIFSGTIIGENSQYGGILGYCKNIDFIGVQNCLSVGKIVADTNCTTAAAIIGNWNGNVTENVKNNYYCLQEGSTTNTGIGNKASNCEAPYTVTAEQLASGEVCYALNGNQTDINWYQTLGIDAHPVLNKNHGLVLYDSSTGIYSNKDEDGISTIKADNPLDDVIHSLSGQRLSKMQKGINIIRYSDGTTRKVIVKQ